MIIVLLKKKSEIKFPDKNVKENVHARMQYAAQFTT